MNDEFITEAIKNDRYLKAGRLREQFEEQIDRQLRNFMKETIEQRPDIFVDDASPSKSTTGVRTEPLAHRRMQANMNRVNREGEHLKFYIAIQWTKPEMHGHEGDGALCLILYKVKNSSESDYERVKHQTQSEPKWNDIQYSDDVWSTGRGIFYMPVTDGPGLKENLQTLQQHFFSFSEEFGLSEESD